MKNQSRVIASAIAVVGLCFGLTALAHTNSRSLAFHQPQKEIAVTAHASGTFEVKLTPQASDDKSQDPSLGRFTIDKQIHGDLEAVGKGQMLTAGTSVKGSAGYVAIERIIGTLHGRSGSFTLQHTGTMNRGVPQLSVTVVPDSGTGQLEGLTGSMNIIIADGKHSYEFEYSLPKTP